VVVVVKAVPAAGQMNPEKREGEEKEAQKSGENAPCPLQKMTSLFYSVFT